MTDPAPQTHHDPHDHHGHGEHDPAARTVERHCDVVVVGGSAAGLAAALQLARQRRSVIVVDDGSPRNAPAEHMHGYLGHEGLPPSELIAIGRAEVRGYGGEVLTGRALAVRPRDGGGFSVEVTGGHRIHARRVVAATGIGDELPAIEGVAQRWGTEVISCPFCHGFEVRDQRLVQIVTHPLGLHPSALLRHLTDRLTIVLHDDAGVDEARVAGLAASGVTVIREKAVRLVDGPEGRLAGVELTDGVTLPADAVLVGTRFHARIDAFAPLGLTAEAHPTGAGEFVQVDATGLTQVPGVYAAGNLTDPSLQVMPAAAHGSRVAAMVAFSLAEEDLEAGLRPSEARTDWEHRYGGEDRMWSANPNGTFVAEVTGMTPGRALDVGAGEGADALWLAERGWQVTAADISDAALARLGSEADRRGLVVERLRVDANDRDGFGADTFDLVSLQYGSFTRTPDQRGVRALLAAVAPGGTLLVVSHDLTPLREPVDVASQTRVFDPDAFVGVTEIAAALRAAGGWQIEVEETRDRPAGAVSTHHVSDVVLRAVRLAS